ncbi:MAG: hypothetical protein EXR94_03965 [Gemmatimonadetes bacterium]|nr:hypothetical protein [Gemmatimonadota bacterium]
MRRRLAFWITVTVVIGAAVFALRGDGGSPVPPPAGAKANLTTDSDTLQPGESLGDVFGRLGIDGGEVSRLVELLGIDPRRVPAGFVVQFGHLDSASGAMAITVRTRPEEETMLARVGPDWIATRRAIRWETSVDRVVGHIESSLAEALERAETSAPVAGDARSRLAWDLADVMAWQVDFTRDVQVQDRFAVVVERRISERGESRLGPILAAEFGGPEPSAHRPSVRDGGRADRVLRRRRRLCSASVSPGAGRIPAGVLGVQSVPASFHSQYLAPAPGSRLRGGFRYPGHGRR